MAGLAKGLSWDTRFKVAVVLSFVVLVAVLVVNRQKGKGKGAPVAEIPGAGGVKPAKATPDVPETPRIVKNEPPGPTEEAGPAKDPQETAEAVPPAPPEMRTADSPPPTTIAEAPPPPSTETLEKGEEKEAVATAPPPPSGLDLPKKVTKDGQAERTAATEEPPLPGLPPSLVTKAGHGDAKSDHPETEPKPADAPPSLAGGNPPPGPPEPDKEETVLPSAPNPTKTAESAKLENGPPGLGTAVAAEAPKPEASPPGPAPVTTNPPPVTATDAAPPVALRPAPPVAEAPPVPAEPPPTVATPTPSPSPEPSPEKPRTIPNLEAPPTEPATVAGPSGPLYPIPSVGPRRSSTPRLVADAPPPARTAAPPRSTAAASGDPIEPVVHVVRRGENFWTIARDYYGSGRFYKALWDANKDLAGQPEDLYIGTAIRIPALEDLNRSLIGPARTESGRDDVRKTSSGTKDADASRTSSDSVIMLPARDSTLSPPPSRSKAPAVSRAIRPSRVHVVKPGETLRSIANATLGDSDRSEEIRKLNSDLFEDTDRPKVGMKLKLPDDPPRR